MCNVCMDQIWIIALNGTLKRCPSCSTPTRNGRQAQPVSWSTLGAAVAAIRLGGDNDDGNNDDDKRTEDYDEDAVNGAPAAPAGDL
jgi:hypothetical protein